MYIVLVGGGKVGYYLAKSLVADGHEVLIIEKDPAKCVRLADELGAGSVWQGDGCEAAVMAEAGISRANLVVAVTGDDEDNLVVCQMAKRKFGVPRAIARINNPKNETIFRKLGIDATVSSTELIRAQIEEQIPQQSLVHLLNLRSVGIEFVQVVIPASSPAAGRRVRDLGIPDDAILALVIRDGSAIVPYGETALAAGDEVIAVTTPASEATLRHILLGAG